ncbi:MAG: pilus assembly protein TadG-related protein [Pseudomonadota bacterium]
MPFFNRPPLSNDTGQVAVLFAFMLLPICAIGGLCLDFRHTSNSMQAAQSVLDGAVLAAARQKQSGASASEIKQTLDDFFATQTDPIGGLTCDAPSIAQSATDDSIHAQVECKQATSLSAVIGQDTMPFKIEATSTYSIGMLDAVFVFDVSGSMGGQRLRDLKHAALDAIDIMLPDGAPADVIANTRLAATSYGGTLNAGSYFEQVTGIPPDRTYYHTLDAQYADSDITPGSVFDSMQIALYDADSDSSSPIAEIGDDAIIKVTEQELDEMTIAVTFDGSHSLDGQIESIRFELSGEETARKTENVPPYALYGDSGLDNLNGKRWQPGKYRLRVRAYEGNDQSGTKRFDEVLKFELFVEAQTIPSPRSYSLNSTCVWERLGAEKFTDAKPESGAYLEYNQAWFIEDDTHPTGGYWVEGIQANGRKVLKGKRCATPPPIELTNDRDLLRNYASSLSTDGYTAGHLGIAWGWYLLSEHWDGVFDGSAAPAAYANHSIQKAVVLMTDGEFNVTGWDSQGNSDAQARALCDGMKDQNIAIYSVAFRAPAAGKRVLEHCASNESFFYDANSRDELIAAYKQVALSLSDLRLSH